MEDLPEELTHEPVLLKESIGYLLNEKISGIFVDATLGGGKTTKHILEALDETGKVIGIDQDPRAIEIAARQLQPYSNFKAVRANFRILDRILDQLEIEQVDGIIMDLGLSSIQIREPSRGFSIKLDSRLDMRMDMEKSKTSAYDLLNNLDETSLRRIFKKYGEERWAGRIAARIVERRRNKAIETTAELAKLVVESIPKRFQSWRIHPATRIFQALRIAVNDELEALKEGIEAGVKSLKPQGRIVIISYHSLEDRIVKHKFRHLDRQRNVVKVLTKKPIRATREEIKRNPRARSAKMRAAEKL